MIPFAQFFLVSVGFACFPLFSVLEKEIERKSGPRAIKHEPGKSVSGAHPGSECIFLFVPYRGKSRN